MNASDPIDVAIGSNLRTRRTAQRMSLEELGRRIGVTYQQIQKYETGKNRIAASTLIRIAGALACSPEDLMIGALPDAPREKVRAPSLRALGLAHKADRLASAKFRVVETLVDALTIVDGRAADVRPGTDAPAAPLAH